MGDRELFATSDTGILEDLRAWRRRVEGPGWTLYVKRLSGNDTLLNKSHQAGPYFPNNLVFALFPKIHDSQLENPRSSVWAEIASHDAPRREIRAIWYNNKYRGGTRNECRLTNWGGKSSPLLDPEATGSIVVFAFRQKAESADAESCSVWLCTTVAEEEYLESFTGPIEPGRHQIIQQVPTKTITQLREQEVLFTTGGPHAGRFPEAWLREFPSGHEVASFVVELYPEYEKLLPDERLTKRRAAEYRLYLEIEAAHAMPRIKAGFRDVDEFVNYAHQVTNRRKARSGRSLEYQLMAIFQEEGITSYAYDCSTEGKKRPDFLFPSHADYHNPAFPAESLRMLAAKTTCKDRWRQVTTEADRIPKKHLLTLQEGITKNQFDEMAAHGICLVVPKRLHRAYPAEIRCQLLTLEDFIQEVLRHRP